MANLDDYTLHVLNYPEFSDTDSSETINDYCIQKKRNKILTIDEWVVNYNDDLYYMWGLLQEYLNTSNVNILDQMDYSKFVFFCYKNSSKIDKHMSFSKLLKMN
jgi:hypothetical protein